MSLKVVETKSYLECLSLWERIRSYEETVGVSDIFPGFDRVFAHWFTGELRCPQGALLDYVHGGYSSTYEYDLLMEFKQGVLVNTHARHNENPKKAKQ